MNQKHCIENHGEIPTLYWVFACSLGLGGLALGSFIDLPLDIEWYAPDTFWAQLMAAYAPVPCFWWLLAAGLAVWRWPDITTTWKKIGAALTGIIAAVGCIGYVTLAAQEPLHLSFWISLAAAVIVVGVPGWMLFLQLQQAAPDQRKRMIGCILLVCAGQFALVQIIKEIQSRPRFLAMLADPEVPFLNWWQNGQWVKEKFFGLYLVDPDLFKSFPSGHTASAACSLLGCLLALGNSNYCARRLFLAGILFSVLTALSRMILGYHFLSDVSVGFLIVLGLFALGWHFILPKQSVQEH